MLKRKKLVFNIVSPLKRTRLKKQEIFLQFIMISIDILLKQKKVLDSMDMRILKKLLKELKQIQNTSKTGKLETETTNNISDIPRVMTTN